MLPCPHDPFPHKYTSTLKKHLEKCHPKEYQIVIAEDAQGKADRDAKAKAKVERRLLKNRVMPTEASMPYDTSDQWYHFITHHLAFFIR